MEAFIISVAGANRYFRARRGPVQAISRLDQTSPSMPEAAEIEPCAAGQPRWPVDAWCRRVPTKSILQPATHRLDEMVRARRHRDRHRPAPPRRRPCATIFAGIRAGRGEGKAEIGAHQHNDRGSSIPGKTRARATLVDAAARLGSQWEIMRARAAACADKGRQRSGWVSSSPWRVYAARRGGDTMVGRALCWYASVIRRADVTGNLR